MDLVPCDYLNPLAVVKEYKLCRVKTIRVSISTIKDLETSPHQYQSHCRPQCYFQCQSPENKEKPSLVNPAEYFFCDLTNQFNVMC